ncbi:MAG: hypothetical protein LUE89_00035 [Clostridiales bacterium]|nr:hypothetical protein [Clostridiales bacterium]
MTLTIISGVRALAGIIAGYALCELSHKIRRDRRERKRRERLQATKKERTAEMFREIGGNV